MRIRAASPPESSAGYGQHNKGRRVLTDVSYEADIRIERVKGPHRLAYLPALEGPIEFGVHGGIAEHYGVEPDVERTTTIDYVIAATGG